jgi:superfamily II helicase
MKGIKCTKCKRFLTYEMLNDIESEELKQKGEFVCSDCINEEMLNEMKGGKKQNDNSKLKKKNASRARHKISLCLWTKRR